MHLNTIQEKAQALKKINYLWQTSFQPEIRDTVSFLLTRAEAPLPTSGPEETRTGNN